MIECLEYAEYLLIISVFLLLGFAFMGCERGSLLCSYKVYAILCFIIFSEVVAIVTCRV